MKLTLISFFTLFVSLAFSQMDQLVNAFGQYQISADVCGANNVACDIIIEKPIGATTVYKAYVYYTGIPFQSPSTELGADQVSIQGGGISNQIVLMNTYTSSTVFNPPLPPQTCYTRYEDVTTLLSPGLNSANPGDLTVYSSLPASPGSVDGTGIVVIWNNPTVPNTAVHLSIGSASTFNTYTDTLLTAPINTQAPIFEATMGVGISWSKGHDDVPAGGITQTSTIHINGGILDTNAGGYEDGDGTMNFGTLITLGGYGDSKLTNDDEYYDFSSLIPNGATQIEYFIESSSIHTADWLDVVYYEIRGVDAPINYDLDTSICEGDSILLEGSYQTTSGIYTDTLIASTGMDSIVSVNLTVVPLPDISAGIDDTTCMLSNYQLDADSDVGIGSWSGVGTFSDVNSESSHVSVESPGVYEFAWTVVNEGMCTSSDTVEITFYTIPPPSFTVEVEPCAPFLGTFISQTSSDIVNCNWTINESISFSGCDTTAYLFPSSGTFDVTLDVVSNEGCTSSVTYDDIVTIDEGPTAGFSPLAIEITPPDMEVAFVNASVGAVEYIWNFNDGSNSVTEVNPIHEFPNNESSESYTVELIAISEQGCADTIQGYVSVIEDLIFYVPNAFTPDGDEYNNVFLPIFTSGFAPDEYHLVIFNRWGEIIWESFDSEVGWDGTYNGSMCQNGIFTWKIDIKALHNDERMEFFGHVNLLK